VLEALQKSETDPSALQNIFDIPCIVVRTNRHLHCKSTQTDDEEASLDPQRYKSVLCRNWQSRHECPYEDRCVYAHGYKELRSVQQNIISVAHVMPLVPKEITWLQGRLSSMSMPPTPPRGGSPMPQSGGAAEKYKSLGGNIKQRTVRFDPSIHSPPAALPRGQQHNSPNAISSPLPIHFSPAGAIFRYPFMERNFPTSPSN
jgi:hypothetical protein